MTRHPGDQPRLRRAQRRLPRAGHIPLWTHVLIAIAATAALSLLGIGLHVHVPGSGFLFMYVPLIAGLALAGGRAAGVTAALLATLSAWYFIVPPVRSLALSDLFAPTLDLFALAAVATGLGFGLVRDIDERRRQVECARLHLAAIVESSDDYIASKTLDGIILTWNAGAQRLYGYTPDEVIGRPVSMLAPPERRDEIPSIMARLRRGERIEHHETVRVRKDGTRFDVSVTYSPIKDASGRLIGASAIGRDITDRKRDERAQRLLAEAGSLLVGSRDVGAALDALARLAVPTLADWCVVDLVEDDGRLHRLVTVHEDPARVLLARQLEQQRPTDLHARSGAPHVVRTGESELYTEITEDLLTATVPDPEVRRLLRDLGLRSARVVPLRGRHRTLGALSFITAESGRRYHTRDLGLAEELARRAALALENARLHEAEQAARRAAERAADRTTRLQATTAALSTAVSPQQVAGVILDHAVRGLGAAAAALSLLTEDGSLELIQATGYPDEIVRRWRRFERDQYGGIADALRTHRVTWQASLADLHAAYPGHEPLPGTVGRGARAAVPLLLADRAFGVLYLNFRDPRTFDAEDLDFMLTLGQQCAQALERARLYAREHRVAATRQRALLPTRLPVLPGYLIDAVYQAGLSESDVGGDWYDAVQLPDGRVALAIGDVVGRGLGAAVIMGQIRQSIRAAILEGHSPARTLALADRALHLTHAGQGMTTAIVGVLDPLASTYTYAAAGHPAPLLATPEGTEPLPSGGLPLGFVEDRPVPCWTVDLGPGSLLVHYTDGVTEARRDPAGGLAVLRSAVEQVRSEHPARPARALLDRVGLRDVPDDIAILAVALDPAPLERLDLTLPAEPHSLRLVRQNVRRLSQTVGLDDSRTFALSAAVGEAVHNAIAHAYGATPGPVAVRVWREDDALRVEVADRGRWRPPRPGEGQGLGLRIVRALAEAVEIVPAEQGTTVRFAVPLARALPVGPLAIPPRAVPALPSPVPRVENEAASCGSRGAAGPFALRPDGGAPVVEVGGDVDLTTLGLFTDVLARAVAQFEGAVIVAIPGTAYMDSQGIRALLHFGRRLRTTRRVLAVVVPRGSPLRQLLETVDLAAVCPLFDSVVEALSAVPPSAASR